MLGWEDFLGIWSKSDFFTKCLISYLMNHSSSAQKEMPNLKENIAQDTLAGILKQHTG